MSLIPFNLQDALAGKPVKSRAGRKVVEIYRFEGSSENEQLLMARFDDDTGVRSFEDDGKFYACDDEYPDDLFMAPVESIDDIKAEIAELQKLNAELTKDRDALRAEAMAIDRLALETEVNALRKLYRWHSISTPPTAEDGAELAGRIAASVVWTHATDERHANTWVGSWDCPGCATHWTTLPAFTPKDKFEEWFDLWWKDNQECYLPEVKGSARAAWQAARKEKS